VIPSEGVTTQFYHNNFITSVGSKNTGPCVVVLDEKKLKQP